MPAPNPTALAAFAGDTMPDESTPMTDDAGEISVTDVGEEDGFEDYADILPLLEENAKEIEDAAMDLEAENFTALLLPDADPPDPEMVASVAEDFEGMDEDLQLGLQGLAGIDGEGAQALAEYMAEAGDIQETDKVALWLLVLGKGVLNGEGAGLDEDEELEEDEDAEDLDDAGAPDSDEELDFG